VGDTSESHLPSALPDAFLQLGGVLLGEDSVDELLDRVVQLASATVPSAHSVSISVTRDGRVSTANSSGPDAVELDNAQYDEEAGPCLDAIGGTQVEADLSQEADRWPRLSARAVQLGVRKVLSTPLTVRERAFGALNIYSQTQSGFSDVDKHVAKLFAEQAAVLLANAFTLLGSIQLGEQLWEALASRELIGEAKGILMQQQSCTRDEAFDILRRASQRENRKLRDLAESLVLAVEGRAETQRAPE
jgi:GAF domain-containing protein